MAELKSQDKKKKTVGVSQANKNGKRRFISSKSWNKSMEKAAAMRKSKGISGSKRKLSYGSDENGSESDDISTQQLKKRK